MMTVVFLYSSDAQPPACGPNPVSNWKTRNMTHNIKKLHALQIIHLLSYMFLCQLQAAHVYLQF